jgi:hypothetical protein
MFSTVKLLYGATLKLDAFSAQSHGFPVGFFASFRWGNNDPV